MNWNIVPNGSLNLPPGVALSDPNTPSLLGFGAVEAAASKTLGAFTFDLKASAQGRVECLNAPEDDDARVVGDGAPVQNGQLTPVFTLDAKVNWLKYSAEVTVRADAGAEFPYLSLDASGERTVVISDYRPHDPAELLQAAVTGDIKGLRSVLDVGQLARLGKHDALVFQARGRIQASAEVAWGDVLSTQLRPLTRLLQAGELVRLEARAGAKVAVDVGVTDDFIVVFSRGASGGIRVDLRKVVARSAGATADIGISVGIRNPEALAAAVRDLLSGLLDAAYDRVVEVVETSGAGALAEDVRQALERFGVELPLDPAKAKAELEKLEARVAEGLLLALRQRLELGFTYAWTRTQEETALVSVELPEALARAHHAQLLLGNFKPLLGPDAPQEVQVMRSWFQALTGQRRTWGFSLEVGPFKASSKDTKELRRVVQRNSLAGDATRIALAGARSYEGTWGGTSFQWFADFRADMRQAHREPDTTHFDYGLYLCLQRKGPDTDELREMVDDASVWRVVDDGDLPRIREWAQGASQLDGRVELRFGHEVLVQLLDHAVAGDALSAYARALARALPWDRAPARDRAELRELIYAPVWKDFLERGGASPADMAKSVSAYVKKHPLASGYFLEEQRWDRFHGVGSVVARNRGTEDKWRYLERGARTLHGCVSGSRRVDLLHDVFGHFEFGWRTAFHVRAFGAFLLDRAARTPTQLSGVERTFTLTADGKSAVFTRTRA